ncbi:MAG TPA: TlyA family RNA methyltransferase [Roseiflexaceae bacterium]|nr:TlyA family RNA methyltransferase [Roseiflexaceae bacterium]
MAKNKVRLDQLLVQRGLAETRSKAQALILAGSVRVDGAPHTKAGEQIAEDAAVELTESLPYASRGGYKLAHALDSFGLDPSGLIALDVGASTGGFTHVLLQRGAARVFAVDVGYGLIDWRLRQDPRVIVVERTNIRYLEALPALETRDVRLEASEASQASSLKPQASTLADCATIDVSFISLKLVLPAVRGLITPDAWIVALVKPQFEAGAAQVGKGGVVRDPAVHAAVLRNVLSSAAAGGLAPHGLVRSPITGSAGNVEFLAWLGVPGPKLNVERAIGEVVGKSQ